MKSMNLESYLIKVPTSEFLEAKTMLIKLATININILPIKNIRLQNKVELNKVPSLISIQRALRILGVENTTKA